MTKLIHIGEREIKANNLEGDEYLVYPNSCPNCGRETNELLDIYKTESTGTIRYSANIAVPLCPQCKEARAFYNIFEKVMLIFGATVGFFVFFLLASLLSAGTDDSGCFLFILMIVCVIAGGYAAAKLGHDKLAVPFFPLGFDTYHAIDLQFNQNHNDSVLNGWTVVIRDNDWADKVQVNGFDVHTVEEKENTMEDEKLILGNVPEPYYDKKAATRNGLLSGAIAGGVIGIILLIITTSSGMFLIGLVTLLVMAGLGALGGMIIAVKMGEGAGANGLEGFKKGTLFIGALPALVIGILPSVIILFVVALIMG